MKRLLFIFSFLPFVAFASFDYYYNGTTVKVDRVRRFVWTGYNKTARATSTDTLFPDDYAAVFPFITSSIFAIAIQTSNNSTTIIAPSPSSLFVSSEFLSSQNVTNAVGCTTNDSRCAASLFIFPEFNSVFYSVASLYRNGYRGTGIVDDFSSGNYHCLNIDYPSLVSDVLSSTNTLYRNLLLNSLASIQSSVNQIGTDLSFVNQAVNSISVSNSEGFRSLASVSSNGFSSVHSGLNSLVSVSSNGFSSVHSGLNSLASVSSNGFSSVHSGLNSLASVSSNGFISVNSGLSTVHEGLEAVHDDLDAVQNFQNDSARLAIDCQNWLDDGKPWWEFVRGEVVSLNPAFNWAQAGDTAVRDFVSRVLSNSGNPGQILADLVEGKPSYLLDTLNAYIPSFYLSDQALSGMPYPNVSNIGALYSRPEVVSARKGFFDQKSLRDHVDDFKKSVDQAIDYQFGYNTPVSTNSFSSSTNRLPFTSFVTNFVTCVITNEIANSAADISSNVVDQASATRDLLDEKLFDPNADGVNVKIKFPLRYYSSDEVNVHDAALDDILHNLYSYSNMMSNLIEGAFLDISSNLNLTNALDFGSITNLLADILDAVTNRPSYLLLDHYSNYISNEVYSSSVEAFATDFPGVYENLIKYGLSPDGGSGGFWTLFGANLLFQSGLVGELLSDMALIRDFADEHIEGGFTNGFGRIARMFPTPTQLEDQFGSFSNQLSFIEQSTNSFFEAFYSYTNRASSVFSPFSGHFSSVPDSIVFFKTANEQYIEIPVGEQREAWRIIRLGISFGLVAVQFLLFPKFVLLFVFMFQKVSKRFIKFVPTAR